MLPVPADLQKEQQCSICANESIMECVECIRNSAPSSNCAPTFCSSQCYLKHHQNSHRVCKRTSSSSGSSSGPSSPSSMSSSETSMSPAAPFGRRDVWHLQHAYLHMQQQPPPPRYAMHRHPIEVGGPMQQQHHRRGGR